MTDSDDVSAFFWLSLAITLAIQLVGFLHAFVFQTEKFFDALGGINSLALVGVALATGGGDWGAREVAIAVMFSFSRAWLLVFLLWRAQARDGDGRFDDIKPYFCSFMIAWILQAVWVFCVAMPFIVVAGSAGEDVALAVGDVICIGLFAVGFVCQVMSDIQKARWVAAGRPGGFCRAGLWNWSRHPNYFGEILMWWCAWGLCVQLVVKGVISLAWAGIAMLSPVLTMLLLLLVSGIPFAEGRALRRYQGNAEYQEYRRSTSPLVPLPFWSSIPRCLQRTIFCEFPMYEYPGDGDKDAESKPAYGALPTQ